MGGVPRKLRHFSRLASAPLADSKIRGPPSPSGKKRTVRIEGWGEVNEVHTVERRCYGREDVCLAALDKIASLLIKHCGRMSLLNSVVNTRPATTQACPGHYASARAEELPLTR